MRRHLWTGSGWASLGLGAIGVFVPLLPTVPFVILAAFCFARGNPKTERWLVEHPTYGPHIQAWRSRGAISRKGKVAASFAFAVSAGIGLWHLTMPWALIPLAAAIIGGTWIWTRPE